MRFDIAIIIIVLRVNSHISACRYILNNAITTLPDGLLSGLTELEILDLSDNGLSTISASQFSDLASLQRLFACSYAVLFIFERQYL